MVLFHLRNVAAATAVAVVVAADAAYEESKTKTVERANTANSANSAHVNAKWQNWEASQWFYSNGIQIYVKEYLLPNVYFIYEQGNDGKTASNVYMYERPNAFSVVSCSLNDFFSRFVLGYIER